MGNTEEGDLVPENGNGQSLNERKGLQDGDFERLGIIRAGKVETTSGISQNGDDDDVHVSAKGDSRDFKRIKKVHFEDDEPKDRKETQEDSVVHLGSFSGKRSTGRCDRKEKDKEVDRYKRMKEKIHEKRRIYAEEKADLAKKLEGIKASFDEEVKKYEHLLKEKRQDYMAQLNHLKIDDHVSSIDKRMADLEQLERELNSRMEHSLAYEKEIQEFENYLSRRQELCQTREIDLQRQKEELDTLHEELEADRFNLEGKGFDTSRAGSRQNRTLQTKDTTDGEDYILKANLRKCQLQLADSENQHARDATEITSLTRELEEERETSKRQAQKIKHLESQLSVYISLSRPAGSDHQSLRSFGSKVSQDGSEDNRVAAGTVRSNANLERLKSGQLSVNQEAQIRHKLRQKRGKQKSKGDQRKSSYLPRRNSSDSGRGSSQAMVDTSGVRTADQVGKNTKSGVCTIL